jgi:hypothetical protein
MGQCQVPDCECLLEAHPMVIERDDEETILGFFCPCHTRVTYATICDLYNEAELRRK